MNTILNVTVFKCDHCSKKMFRGHAMVNHEKWCTSNPKNFKACSGCSFLEETVNRYDVDTHDGWYTRKSKAFKCTKKDILVYPLKVEKKGLLEKYPETFEDQIPMPRECNQFESMY